MPDQGKPSDPEYAGSANTVTEIINEFDARGFTAQMAAREAGDLICFECRSQARAEEFELVDLRRTEGASDPDDMTAIVALTCPRCGAKGTAVFKYGGEAPPEDAAALRHFDR